MVRRFAGSKVQRFKGSKVRRFEGFGETPRFRESAPPFRGEKAYHTTLSSVKNQTYRLFSMSHQSHRGKCLAVRRTKGTRERAAERCARGAGAARRRCVPSDDRMSPPSGIRASGRGFAGGTIAPTFRNTAPWEPGACGLVRPRFACAVTQHHGEVRHPGPATTTEPRANRQATPLWKTVATANVGPPYAKTSRKSMPSAARA